MKAKTKTMLKTGLLAGLLQVSAAHAGPAGAPGRAEQMAQEFLLIDTHIDVPYRVAEAWVDVSEATEGGDFDYPRARRGGLNLPFMAIYTPAEMEREDGDAGESFQLANRLIDSVEALAARAPDKFMLVRSAADAERVLQSGRIGLAMGLENGSPIDRKLENVRFFAERGVAYITLAHALSNHIADSSYDDNRRWQGLSPFGREVVAEMNRAGVMIDVSHVTDEAFFQVLELSQAPVIASHSSPRHFTPGFERNLSDEMIRALAAKGGVVQITFGSGFLTAEAQAWGDAMWAERSAFLEANGLAEDGEEAQRFEADYRLAHPYPFATLADLVASFEHAIALVGPRHVGIGSDFEGVGDSLPVGMKDVSYYPALIGELLKRGHSEADLRAIMGGNLLRVWRQVEETARTR